MVRTGFTSFYQDVQSRLVGIGLGLVVLCRWVGVGFGGYVNFCTFGFVGRGEMGQAPPVDSFGEVWFEWGGASPIFRLNRFDVAI